MNREALAYTMTYAMAHIDDTYLAEAEELLHTPTEPPRPRFYTRPLWRYLAASVAALLLTTVVLLPLVKGNSYLFEWLKEDSSSGSDAAPPVGNAGEVSGDDGPTGGNVNGGQSVSTTVGIDTSDTTDAPSAVSTFPVTTTVAPDTTAHLPVPEATE